MTDQEHVKVEEPASAPTPPAKRGKKKDGELPRPETFIQLFHKDGSVLFTSQVPKPEMYYRSERDKHFREHLPQILRAAFDQEIDISQLDLSDTDLSGVNLRNLHLSGVDFHGCNFNEADLRGCGLQGCNFDDCAFDGARMTGADITGANINDCNFAHTEARDIYGLIMLAELNDYFVYGYPRPTGHVYPNGQKAYELRIKAGCRDFNLAQARHHWSVDNDEKHPVSGREEIWAALPLLEAVAKSKGWQTTQEPVQPVDTDPGRGDDALEEEEDE